MTRISLIFFFHEHNVPVEPLESEGARHLGQKHHDKDMAFIHFKDGTSHLLKNEGMLKTNKRMDFPFFQAKLLS